MSLSTTTTMGAGGLFGKIPAQADFLRLNVAAPAAQALVSWLHQAIEAVHRAGAPLPARPVRFLFRVRGSTESLVGALAASQDRVGRAFPLCAFVPVPTALLASAYPGLPVASERLAAACEALLVGAAGHDGPGLGAAVQSLPALEEPALAAARLAAEAARAPAAEVLGPGFAELPDGAPAYALSALEKATRAVWGREPDRSGVSLDCPAGTALQRWFWLELLRRTLGWSVPPVLFWTDDRLVASLGAPHASVLRHLSDPSRPGDDVWPLRTGVARAIAAAAQELPAGVRRALARESAAALLDALARKGGSRA